MRRMKALAGKQLPRPSKQEASKSGCLLSRKNSLPFMLCFCYKLAKGYTFSDLSQSDVKTFQRFLDKVSKMTFTLVEKQFLRETDKQDLYDGMQVVHYGVSERFRIHGVVAENKFAVLRLDPNHRFHG